MIEKSCRRRQSRRRFFRIKEENFVNKKYGLDDQFNRNFLWPILAALLMILVDAYFMLHNMHVAMAITGVILLYLLAIIFNCLRRKEAFIDEILDMATQYGQVQKRLIQELALPYILLDEEGSVFWMNDDAKEEFHQESNFHGTISSLMPEFDETLIEQLQDKAEVTVQAEDKIYSVQMERLGFEAPAEEASIDGGLISLVFYDKTEFFRYKTEVEDQKMVFGLIYLDNYDETLSTMEDVKTSLLSALLERKIKKYFNAEDGIVRKMDKDKFMIILKAKNFKHLQEERFTLLSEIKTVNIGDDISVTISMGFGIDAGSYAETMNLARAAIEIALGRGGDQAVIKSPTEQAYYGGATSQMNRNTRVKARVKAQAFRELVQNSEHIFIMGHSMIDVDAFGAAIGLYRAIDTVFGKKANVVIDSVPSGMKPFLDLYQNEKEIFLTGAAAQEEITPESLVVVVDTNKSSLCECPQLLEQARNVVVFDHHRVGADRIRNSILAYIEPYASSVCEMITEMLPYFDENIRIQRADADCLYAGIVIDTHNFMSKTGVRTFEAAAYLRRNGADVTRVRQMLREDMKTYKSKAEIVLHTEVYQEQFAIGVCENEELESPTIVGAQAADELLNIIGIKASFVLTPFKGQIYVSARSEDINVQIIMERLGGGGHSTTAGAQLKNCTIAEAKTMIEEAVDQLMKERKEQ